MKYSDPSGESVVVLLTIMGTMMVIEYVSQVSQNNTYKGGERFYKGIDWFDVGIAGANGALMAYGAPLLVFGATLATPWITNGIDIEYQERFEDEKGNLYGQSDGWQIDIVGRKSKHKDGNYVEPDKMWRPYIGSSAVQTITNAAFYAASNANNKFAYSPYRMHSLNNVQSKIVQNIAIDLTLEVASESYGNYNGNQWKDANNSNYMEYRNKNLLNLPPIDPMNIPPDYW